MTLHQSPVGQRRRLGSARLGSVRLGPARPGSEFLNEPAALSRRSDALPSGSAAAGRLAALRDLIRVERLSQLGFAPSVTGSGPWKRARSNMSAVELPTSAVQPSNTWQ